MNNLLKVIGIGLVFGVLGYLLGKDHGSQLSIKRIKKLSKNSAPGKFIKKQYKELKDKLD